MTNYEFAIRVIATSMVSITLSGGRQPGEDTIDLADVIVSNLSLEDIEEAEGFESVAATVDMLDRAGLLKDRGEA